MTRAPPQMVPLAQVPPDMLEALLDQAFGQARCARTAYRVREGMDWLPALSFAALDEDQLLVGTVQVWPVALTDAGERAHPLLMVGPVAVLPEFQGQGYGVALIAMVTKALVASGNPSAGPLPQMLIGDPAYYCRFGFNADHTGGWRLPGPYDQHRLLVRTDNPAILPRAGLLGPWRG